MPILGIMASSVLKVTNSYESIETYTLSSAQSSVTFSSIPATFKHLQVRCFAQSSHSTNVAGYIRLNGNTTITDYSTHLIDGNGSSVSAYGAADDYPQFTIPHSSTSTFSACVIDILDYTNTNKYKTIRSLSGFDANGSGLVRFNSGALYSNTNAITEINIIGSTGNLTQYSSFALYGIKG